MDETTYPLTITIEYRTRKERDDQYERALAGIPIEIWNAIPISKASKQRMRPDLTPHDFLREEDT